MLKLFNLDVSDYASNVYEVKINGDLSLFSGEDKQWIKNDGKIIFTYDGPEEDIADDERSFVFFEKAGNGIIIFIIIKAMFQQDITSVLIYTVRKRVRLFIN